MTEVSFTSRIVPVSISQFGNITSVIGGASHVKFPWGIAQSLVRKDVYTRDIADCTACLITDGQKAVLMHLNPESSVNHCFLYVREFLRNNFGLNRPDLQALVVGSKNTEKSLDIYNKFKSLMKEANIPTSFLKNSKNPVSVAYRSQTDEIYVSSIDITKGLIDKKSHPDIINSSFEKAEISPFDEIA
ncbi:hypothetical protein IKR55_02320 [bacterium]|nr:hypothetical protein [bacterium]